MAYSLAPLYEEEDFMCETKECIVCGQEYRTIDALGKLQCRYHPGLITEDEEEVRRYSCCGQPLNPRAKRYNRMWKFGCTPADHTILERAYEKKDNLELLQRPENIEQYKIIEFDPLTCRYSVWRFDVTQAKYRLQYGTYSAELAARFREDLRTTLQAAEEEEESSDSEFALIESDDDEDDTGSEWTDDEEPVDDDDNNNDNVMPLFT